MKQSELFDLLGDAVYKAQAAFRSITWRSRCDEVKRLESHYMQVQDFNQGLLPSRTSVSTSSLVPPHPRKWIEWLTDWLPFGSDFLKGFRLHINISFVFV